MPVVTLPAPILAEKVIPVARGLIPERALDLARALSAGEISSMEVTMESGKAIAAIEVLAAAGIIVGAGTVMSIDDAVAARDAGATFMVSPHFDPLLVEWALDAAIPFLPGIMTPTEAAAAISLGIATVKLFPAATLGAEMVKALHGPFPDLRIVPTGGITPDNARDFIEAGAVAVGVGSWLTGGDDLALVSNRARRLRQSLQ